jgi:protein phosphatase
MQTYGAVMKAFIFSHPGNNQERHINEDAVLASSIHCGQTMEKPLSETWEAGPVLAAVADGMGGGPGGQEAAGTVLNCLKVLAGRRLGQEDELEDALKQAYNLLVEKAARDPQLRGLGATVAGLWLDQGEALVFNCGDCRVYRLRNGFLDQQSRDHSRVFQLYETGEITYEETRSHPKKHLVSSSVQDGPEPPEVYQKRLLLRPGDAFLICCDGVWEALPLDEMERCLKDKPLEAGSESLAEALRRTDCRDNISFLLLHIAY